MDTSQALFEYLLRLADDRLILGHRLSEWCGHGPVLEEDIALSNIALDLIGHASSLLDYAGRVEGKGRDADRLAYWRGVRSYRNLKMVELPRGDFGFTIARAYLFSTYSHFLYEQLIHSTDDTLRGLSEKALKEIRYHLRHSRDWMLRLGDGTDESHERIQESIDDLWMYTGELFERDEVDAILSTTGIVPDMRDLQGHWDYEVSDTLKQATLIHPDNRQYMDTGGRQGIHTEHLGHLLDEMQSLVRMYPEATW